MSELVVRLQFPEAPGEEASFSTKVSLSSNLRELADLIAEDGLSDLAKPKKFIDPEGKSVGEARVFPESISYDVTEGAAWKQFHEIENSTVFENQHSVSKINYQYLVKHETSASNFLNTYLYRREVNSYSEFYRVTNNKEKFAVLALVLEAQKKKEESREQ